MKRIITIVAFLLFTLSSTAQVYRSGGFFGMGNSTRYGGGGGGGLKSSQTDNSWYIRIGGAMSSFGGSNADKFEDIGDFKGVGGNFEVGKGLNGLNVEYLTLLAEVNESGSSFDAELTQIRVVYKRRHYLTGPIYASLGMGMVVVTPKTNGTSGDTFTELFSPVALGMDFNLGGSLQLFVESGFAIIGGNVTVGVGGASAPAPSSTNNSSSGQFVFDGVKAGLKFRL